MEIDPYANVYAECIDPNEALSVCQEVKNLSLAIQEINRRFIDKSIVSYKIDDEKDIATIERRRVFYRASIVLLDPITLKKMAKKRFLSLVKRVLDVKQRKKFSQEDKTQLLINAQHFPNFYRFGIQNPDFWNSSVTRSEYESAKLEVDKAIEVLKQWKLIYATFLPQTVIIAIDTCLNKIHDIQAVEPGTLYKLINEDYLKHIKQELHEILEENSVQDLKWDCTFREETFKGTALHYVILSNPESISLDYVKYLIDLGANPHDKDENGNSVFSYYDKGLIKGEVYAYLKRVEEEFLLIEKCQNINDLVKAGNSWLHQAVLENKPYLVRYLLKLKADSNVRNVDGNTPLHLACLKGNKEMMGLLKSFKDLDKFPLNDSNLTPLDLFVAHEMEGVDLGNKDNFAEILAQKFHRLMQ